MARSTVRKNEAGKEILIRVICRADGIPHFMPDSDKNYQLYLRKNKVRQEHKRYDITRGIDPDNIPDPPKPAQVVAKEAKRENNDLKAQLEASQRREKELRKALKDKNTPPESGDAPPRERAADVITKIKAATSAEQVDQIVGDDDRASVLKEAERRKAQLASESTAE